MAKIDRRRSPRHRVTLHAMSSFPLLLKVYLRYWTLYQRCNDSSLNRSFKGFALVVTKILLTDVQINARNPAI